MTERLVSVITSNYNAEHYLSGCIASVRSQCYQSWEHLVVDCGSTDNSRLLLEKSSHDRLRVIKEKYCGVACARNIAIRAAKGKYCAILDADDLANADRLKLQVDLLEKNKDLVAVGGGINALYINASLWKRITRRNNGVVLFPSIHQEILILLRCGITTIPHSTLLFRKESFWKLGGYCENMEKAEDYDLILRLGLVGQLANVPQSVGTVRFGVSGSHTTRHRPYGRDATYYVVLALLSTIGREMGVNSSQIRLEQILEKLGNRGIRVVQARWLLSLLRDKGKFISSALKKVVFKNIIVRLPDVIAGGMNSWPTAGRTPEDFLKLHFAGEGSHGK